MDNAPSCPKCGSEMKKRMARKGPNAGKYFFKEELAEVRKQNDQIAKQLASLNARLDEGVNVKKKKWFA